MDGGCWKIVVVGPAAGGKSSICQAYMYGIFPEKYDPTIEDTYDRDVEVLGSFRHVRITDTAGVDCFSQYRMAAIMGADAFLLVYSVATSSSLDNVMPFWDDILNQKADRPFVPIALVGNKIDLQRQVTASQSEELTERFRSARRPLEHFETSAKNFNVKAPFEWVCQQLQSHNPEKVVVDPKRPKCNLL